MEKITYKAPGGKLLRVQLETADDIIKDLKITGDFFIHPEEAITEIENFLIGKELSAIEKSLKNFLAEKNILIIGFTPKDLSFAILNYQDLLSAER